MLISLQTRACVRGNVRFREKAVAEPDNDLGSNLCLRWHKLIFNVRGRLPTPTPRLSNRNDMKNQEQRDDECWNQAQGQDRQGVGRHAVRVDQRSGGPQGHGDHQVGDSKQLPYDKTLPMIGIGKLQRPERRCRSYRDVAQPRRQRKNTW